MVETLLRKPILLDIAMPLNGTIPIPWNIQEMHISWTMTITHSIWDITLDIHGSSPLVPFLSVAVHQWVSTMPNMTTPSILHTKSLSASITTAGSYPTRSTDPLPGMAETMFQQFLMVTCFPLPWPMLEVPLVVFPTTIRSPFPAASTDLYSSSVETTEKRRRTLSLAFPVK